MKIRCSLQYLTLTFYCTAAAQAQVVEQYGLQPKFVPNHSSLESTRVLTSENDASASVDSSRLAKEFDLRYAAPNATRILLSEAEGSAKAIEEKAEGPSAGSIDPTNNPSVVKSEIEKKRISKQSLEKIDSIPPRNESVSQTERDVETERSHKDGIPEILVEGKKVLNMDIERSEDDAQPYVIFDRFEMQRSGAVNLEEFLKNQLTMNVSAMTNGQLGEGGTKSLIDLRGLGSDETLILIDGRRVAGFSGGLSFAQPDINGIPISAIERIEILPATASGIYGGGATGGVVNIVMRRDYSGYEVRLTYGNVLEGSAARRQVDVNGGLNFLDGRTNVLFAASYEDVGRLLNGERSFVQRGRQHILRNNPGFFFDAPSPPLGSTPNIRSNEYVDGERQNLILDDGTPLNSSITFVPVGYAGIDTDGGASLIANAGQFNLELPDTAEPFGRRKALLSSPENKSVMVTVQHEFSSAIRGFLEFQGSETHSEFVVNESLLTTVIPGDAPTNPFQQSIQITVPGFGFDISQSSETQNRKAIAGVITQLPGDWRLAIDYVWNRVRQISLRPKVSSAATHSAILGGSVNVIRDVGMFPGLFEAADFLNSDVSPADSTLRSVTARLAGALPFSLPGGDLTFSMLVEHRKELLDDFTENNATLGPIYFPDRRQSVNSIYLETRIPIFSEHNRKPGIESLDLQLAVRRDDYRVTGATGFIFLNNPAQIVRSTNTDSSVDPTFGLIYRPINGLMIRASYGTGYRPPSVSEITPNPPLSINASFLTDPLRGGESLGVVSRVSGGNALLRAESSDSLSVGLVFAPQWISDARLSVDWSQIQKRDNIGRLNLLTQAGLDLAVTQFPDRIIRGEATDGFDVGPITVLDDTSINIAHLDVEAIDVALDYRLDVGSYGAFDLRFSGTRVVALDVQSTPVVRPVSYLGVLPVQDFATGGLKWKASVMLNWSKGEWNLGWRTRFFDSYFLNTDHTEVVNQGGAKIGSQIYHDFFGSYQFSLSQSGFEILKDSEISFSINNVLNTAPPIDISNSQQFYSRLADPRLANYQLSFRKSFQR